MSHRPATARHGRNAAWDVSKASWHSSRSASSLKKKHKLKTNVEIPDTSPNPPLTDDLLGEVERTLGVKLPASYVNLMRRWNGGPWESHVFPLSRYPDPGNHWLKWDEIEVRGLAGISTDSGEHYSIAGSPSTIREWGLPKGLVLLDYLGSKWIALDYSKRPDPSVVLVEPDEGRKVFLGDDFGQFLGRLVPVKYD